MKELLMILLAAASPCGQSTILTSNGDTMVFTGLTRELLGYDVIFVGEQHDAECAHQAELGILKGLAGLDSNMVLALEMFERDVQDVLDAYLAGEIEEDSFLRVSRPWPNYETDYRPLVEFARQHSIPVVAANVPRRAAAAVARAGKFAPQVLGADSVYLPDTLYLDSDEYHQRFAATMQDMPHQGPMRNMNADALYKAQVLKDAVMAEALEPCLDRRIVFFCGRFHSDFHLGIPYQLKNNHPELKLAVVSLLPASEELSQDDRETIADYLWFYPEQEEKDQPSQD